jgi:hypothetical protein
MVTIVFFLVRLVLNTWDLSRFPVKYFGNFCKLGRVIEKFFFYVHVGVQDTHIHEPFE